ncbi:hypothetical protein OAZ90_01295 [Pelagibacteraceae bacterium]|nr:hypothetical protein [Pelagibacteraceae bacterium]|tara:strand:- start:74 stop:421 length:348 start_codon:yes stop_codon:yes gene_type:complete
MINKITSIPLILLSILLISMASFSKEYSQFGLYLTDEDKFDLWGSYNRGEGAVTDQSPDELIYNHTCLFLSINEENLDMKKGPYTRYKKVNKRKLEERIKYLSSKSFDMTNCILD